MSTETEPRGSRYQVMPIAAFREGQELNHAHLPVRVATRPWRILAWLFFGLCVFVWFGVVAIHLEETYSSTASAHDLDRFPDFLLFVGGLVLASAVYFWGRVDEVAFRRDAVGVKRRGLFGTETREAAISDYRGIRAMP